MTTDYPTMQNLKFVKVPKSSMSTVKFCKVPELFPNRKVRTVRTE